MCCIGPDNLTDGIGADGIVPCGDLHGIRKVRPLRGPCSGNGDVVEVGGGGGGGGGTRSLTAHPRQGFNGNINTFWKSADLHEDSSIL